LYTYDGYIVDMECNFLRYSTLVWELGYPYSASGRDSKKDHFACKPRKLKLISRIKIILKSTR